MDHQCHACVIFVKKLKNLKMGISSVLSLLLLRSSSSAAPPSAKHVVVIVADDLGYGDLGYMGSAVKTPTLDALAHGGIRVPHYYVQRACSPTRACLMTSRYNLRYGMESGVLESSQPFGLDLGEVLLPQALRRAAELAKPAKSSSCNLTAGSGMNCAGGGLPGYAPVSGANATGDPAKCCAMCTALADCKVWTVYNDGGQRSECYLKTSECTPQPHPGAVSGASGKNGTWPPKTVPPSMHPTLPPIKSCPSPATPPSPGSWSTQMVGKVSLLLYRISYGTSSRIS